MAPLLYGAGLRLLECARLRVKDVDFERGEITVRDGKGGKDRVTMLPAAVRGPLRAHLEGVDGQHERDLAAGSRQGGAARRARPRSTRTPAASGPGSGSSRRRGSTRDRAPGERCGAITCTRSVMQRAVTRRGRGRGHRKRGHLPHAAPLVRHAPARGRLRHPHRAGAARPPRRQHDDDLHARAEPRRPGREEPGRQFVSVLHAAKREACRSGEARRPTLAAVSPSHLRPLTCSSARSTASAGRWRPLGRIGQHPG